MMTTLVVNCVTRGDLQCKQVTAYRLLKSEGFHEEDVMDDASKGTIKQFRDAVNMSATQPETWLDTDESQDVGQKDDGGESTGHKMGRTIIALLGKRQSDYTDNDIHEMGRVVSYVHRYMAQRPPGDVTDTRWRYSLMNWGHDPLQK